MLEKKIVALDRIYAAYDRFCATLDVACKKYCAQCCTSNVTLTTLEGHKILDHLIAAGKLNIIDELKRLNIRSRQTGISLKYPPID